jgi:hypothetical protein
MPDRGRRPFPARPDPPTKRSGGWSPAEKAKGNLLLRPVSIQPWTKRRHARETQIPVEARVKLFRLRNRLAFLRASPASPRTPSMILLAYVLHGPSGASGLIPLDERTRKPPSQ